MFRKTTLKNGLRIITSPMKGTKTVTVLALVGTGSKYEIKEINGVSHFLEHMFFKGTKRRPTALDIAETIDRVGGEYNAFTSKEFTGYYAKVSSKHRKLVMDVVSDIFLHSKLDAKEIEREKGVIIEELNMYLDTPISYIKDLFEVLLYGNQPAGWLVIGAKENIKAITREKLLDYLKSQYVASNTIILVAGDIDEEETIEEVEECFKSIIEDKYLGKPSVKERQNKPLSLIHHKKTDQTHFCLGIRSYDFSSKDYFVLQVLTSILGGGMSSRLFIEVREKRGLAYRIRCSSENYTDTGYVVVQAGVGNNRIDESIKVILNEFRKIRDEKVPDKELNKTREYIKGKLLLGLESSDEVAFWLGHQEVLKREILTVDEVFKRIDAVTAKDIQRIASDIFQNSKLNLALIGPFEDKDRFDKILRV
ncbi:MAG: pitrilysin family protein [Candidatus Aerophobetes bacterium]|nr:pitrilysin family protein [Candidatus Aerophobetes bacterium]